MKRILAIATLLLATCSAIPAEAAFSQSRRDRDISATPVSTEGVLLADSRVDDAWDQYKDERHRILDRQMNNEMNKPHNSRLSQREKEKVIREAHQALDKQLDREEKEWKKRYSDSRYRNDRYNRSSDRSRRSRQDWCSDNRNRDRCYYDDDYNRDRRYRDRDSRYEQNPYEDYRRRNY